MRSHLRSGFVCGLLLALAGVAAWAEVSTDVRDGRVRFMIMMSITDDADPVNRLYWEPLRPLPAEAFLNPAGDTRPDGLPDIAWHPSGGPAVIWAFKNPTDHDIVFSRWAVDAWGPTQFLAFGSEDEKDPRVFVEPDGALHAVWWVDGGDPQVMLTGAQATTQTEIPASWLAPVRVNPLGDPGRRPSVAVFGGHVRVAYERAMPTGTANSPGEVVVLRQEPGGTFVVEHVFPSQRTEDAAPVLHVGDDRIWLTWKYSATQFASSRFENLEWGPVNVHDWSDPSWVGIEGLRKSIGSEIVPATRLVIAPPTPGDPGSPAP